MQEFINPKSMMTPGIAGATMMFIVNGIVFAFPELQPRIIALLLSFIIGSIVFASQNTPSPALWTKGVYWVVNSLIIFVVGFGTTHLAANNTAQAQKNAEGGSLFPSFITSALAQSSNVVSTSTQKSADKLMQSTAKLNEHKRIDLLKQLEIERKKNAELTEQLSTLHTDQRNAEDALKATAQVKSEYKLKQESQFFKQW